MKLATLAFFLLSMNSFAQVSDQFSCRLNRDSAGFQMQLRNYQNASDSMKPAILNVLDLMKSRCEQKTNEASCNKDSNCISVLLEIRMVPQVVGIKDSRSFEPVRELSDGSITKR